MCLVHVSMRFQVACAIAEDSGAVDAAHGRALRCNRDMVGLPGVWKCQGGTAGQCEGSAGVLRCGDSRMKSHMSVVASRLLIFGSAPCSAKA